MTRVQLKFSNHCSLILMSGLEVGGSRTATRSSISGKGRVQKKELASKWGLVRYSRSF
jgi:hypothetical protein